MPVNPFANALGGGVTPEPKPKPQGDNPFAGATVGGAGQPTAQPGTPSLETAAPALPFMALDTDHYGQAYYGPGLKGWARKFYAKVFDPKFFMPSPTKEQAQFVEKGVALGEKKLNDKIGWDQWIGKWTGIQAEDVTRSAVSLAMGVGQKKEIDPLTGEERMVEATGAEKAQGFFKNIIAAEGRGLYQSVWTGLDALGLIAKASRRVQAWNAALDDIGDSSAVLPDITRGEETARKYFGDSPAMQRIGQLTDAWQDVFNPVALVYNAVRAVSAKGALTDKWKTVTDYQKGSNMMYTMYWDQAKKEEYLRRVRAGENPDILVSELENPWVELAGDILGDPTTYMGMGIIGNFGKAKTAVKIPFTSVKLFDLPWNTVGHIPGFSEILGLKSIGKARLASAAEDFTKIADPNLEKAFQAVGNASDEAQAVKLVNGMLSETRKAIQKFSKNYGVLAPEATAKADIMKKTVGTVFSTMAARWRNFDDMAETFKAFRALGNENPETAYKALSQLKELYGPLPFSHAGMQAMEFFNRLTDEVKVADLVSQGVDMPKTIEKLEQGLFKVVDDAFPSVNDMAEASKVVKTGQFTERQKSLADAYTDLQKTKPAVIWSNSVNNLIAGNKAYQGMQKFFAGVFMGMSPAYALRNLQSNTFHIWHDLGGGIAGEAFTEGLKTFGVSTAESVARKAGQEVNWVDNLVNGKVEKIKKMLGGATPYEAAKGIGQVGRPGEGFIKVGQDIEKVQSAMIVSHVVETEMEKMLRYGGLPAVDALEKAGFEPTHANRMYTLLLENFGDSKAALTQFRKEVSSGHFEAWRNLELDGNFKDWLRKSNLYDELDDIRKTSETSGEFTERMNAFAQKIDDLAQRVADEPALVSMDNPLGESVATIEKAFDEGSKALSREELNDFRAMTELNDQLRNAYKDVGDALRSWLSRYVQDPAAVKSFDDQFNGLNQVFGKSVATNRNLATDFYEGAYQQSRKGTPAADLWRKVNAVISDMQDGRPVLKRVSLADAFPDVDPTTLSGEEFRSMAWKWIKDTQSEFWRGVNQDFMVQHDNILEEMAASIGRTLDDVKLERFGDLSNPQLTRVDELAQQVKQWEEYINPAQVSALAKKVPPGTKLSAMELKGVESWAGGKTKLFNAVNADRASKGLDTYKTIDEVPFDEAVTALKKRIGKAPIPPHVETAAPTVARQLYENWKGGAKDALQEFVSGTLTKWGEKTPVSGLSDEMETALSKYVSEVDTRLVPMRAAAASVANETRNFILHDYNKNYLDKFLGFGLQYHYWPSRTYMRWIERGMDTPGVLSAYAKARDAADKVNADMPEWWRYNVPVGKLLGMQNSPMYFNLEATLNPLNGLTGTDFNDPAKRVDWLSSSVDDMGKMGFGMAIPLQWAMAFNLYKKGEDDAARRWVGRAVPATQTLKAGLNVLQEKTGIDLMPKLGFLPGAQYGEFDPFVNVMSQGIDPYEEKRVNRAMAMLIQENPELKEQGYDELYAKQGQLYDQAVQRAINERAGGQLASFFLGVGYKNRSEGDMMVDQFYNEYSKLLGLRGMTSPENYKKAYDELMGKYEFADSVLLARRGGDDRDAAYAYNVIGRVPPGDSFNMFQSIGLSEDLVTKFYQDKGDFSKWTPQDKERFMGAMLDIGTAYAMPENATREEWTAVKTQYQQVRDQIAQQYGKDIWDKMTTYYDLMDTNGDDAEVFKQQHPEIAQAQLMKQEAVVNNPMLYSYYGSLDTIESYYNGSIRAQLVEKFGNDITNKQSEYFALGVESKAKAKAYLNAHPELKGYWSEKKKLEQGQNAAILHIASGLPTSAEGAQLREDFAPANATQEALAQFAQQPVVSWQELGSYMSAPLKARVEEYWMNGGTGQLSNAAIKELDYLARRYDYYDADDLLRQAGFSIMQSQQQPAMGGPAGPSSNPFSGATVVP